MQVLYNAVSSRQKKSQRIGSKRVINSKIDPRKRLPLRFRWAVKVAIFRKMRAFAFLLPFPAKSNLVIAARDSFQIAQ